MNSKTILIGMALLGSALTGTAQVADTTGVNPYTTVGQERVIPLVTTKIHLSTRSYGDSIVLRWVAEDYVSYNYLARFGVNVLRVPHVGADSAIGEDFTVDTLAFELRPKTLEQFRSRYAANDSMAYVAMGVLYGEKENYHKENTYMGTTMNQSDDQDLSYAFAMLVADWRKDLAEDLAVRFTDRTAERGRSYDYYVQPTRWDNGGRLIFEPGVVEDVKNEPYEPEVYALQFTDTITAPYQIRLGWWDGKHSSFEVERRQITDVMGQSVDGQWVRVTDKPYVPMVEQPEGEDYCLMVDTVPQLGLWEYRVMAYDPFGDMTAPATHTLFVGDVEPPVPPVLKRIVLERPDDDDPMAEVHAHVIWEKDTIEADLTGYRLYYQPNQGGNGWQPLNVDLIDPQDTIHVFDVTGLRTGMVYLAAYDQTGNESHSMVQMMQLRDYKAPLPPTNLRAEIRPLDINRDSAVVKSKWAYIDLYWQPNAEDDDIQYFDVAFANDTTHDVLVRNNGGLQESVFTDSIALNANQRYIYYRVRAVDFSTNIGKWSEWLQVERPHITPPTQPHLGRSSHDDLTGMHMEWIVGADADMVRHVLYRRLGDEGPWEIVDKYYDDNVKADSNRIVVDDNPPYSQDKRYYYMMRSINQSPFTSQSLAVSWRHMGPRILDLPIMLTGEYDEDDHSTLLVWSLATDDIPEGEYHFSIFRKGPGDEKFKFYTSTAADQPIYTEHTLRPGQTAEYYVQVYYTDGRAGQPSDTVSVTAIEPATSDATTTPGTITEP